MVKVLQVIAVVIAAVLVGAVPVAGASPLRGAISGPTVGFNPDPAAVAARCPAGSEWILQTAASGQLSSAVYSGPVDAIGEHCSRWIVQTERGHAVGKVAAGVLTVMTPGGDELLLAYQGTFVFNGDPAAGVWRSDVSMSYTTIGGTGVFAGALGDGHIAAVDNSGYQTVELIGSLRAGR